MKNVILSFFLLASHIAGAAPFPTSPVVDTTPGDFCQHADEIRYPERIIYCKRAVSSQTKDAVIDHYDRVHGFQIRKVGRSSFKIDHFIPLCMGGSNEPSNLWPQHSSIYQVTDPLEEPACKKMGEGKLLQRRAVELIREAKMNPARSKAILAIILAL